MSDTTKVKEELLNLAYVPPGESRDGPLQLFHPNDILTLIDKYTRDSRIDENNRYLEMLKTGKWRSFGIEVTDRIAQLTEQKDGE